MNFIWYILIGILAGYFAGKIMRGGGFTFGQSLIRDYRRCAGRLGVCPSGTGSNRNYR